MSCKCERDSAQADANGLTYLALGSKKVKGESTGGGIYDVQSTSWKESLCNYAAA